MQPGLQPQILENPVATITFEITAITTSVNILIHVISVQFEHLANWLNIALA